MVAAAVCVRTQERFVRQKPKLFFKEVYLESTQNCKIILFFATEQNNSPSCRGLILFWGLLQVGETETRLTQSSIQLNIISLQLQEGPKRVLGSRGEVVVFF